MSCLEALPADQAAPLKAMAAEFLGRDVSPSTDAATGGNQKQQAAH
jgi:hypothetical protein